MRLKFYWVLPPRAISEAFAQTRERQYVRLHLEVRNLSTTHLDKWSSGSK